MVQDKKIAIISSDKFVGRIKEDVWLREALLNAGENAEIVSWEDQTIHWKNYKSAILKSAWGYHRDINKFVEFLQKLERFSVRLFNDTQVVRWNIQKDLQFNDLIHLGINIVPTIFIKNHQFNLRNILDDFSESGKNHHFVIKPIISGSGENTFFISLDKEKSKLKNQIPIEIAQNMFQTLISNKKIKGLMIQPFLSGVTNGEYSFIFIDSCLTHGAVRYPGIFTDKKEPREIDLDLLPLKIINFAKKCQSALNLISGRFSSSPVYTRCDVVENNGEFFLMEAEMAEPDLLIKTISTEQKKNDVVRQLVNAVLTRSR